MDFSWENYLKSICVLPETKKYEKINCYGICSDFILKYRELKK